MIEICYLQFQAGPNAPLAFLTHWTQIGAKHVAQAIKEFGARQPRPLLRPRAERQHDAPGRAGGRRSRAMKREGITDADIDTMMRKNPARLLGLN